MKTSIKRSTSDARLIKKIASFGTADGTDDLDSDDPKTYERWAKSIIRIVRRSDRRRRLRKHG